jgi:hypothetical protein
MVPYACLNPVAGPVSVDLIFAIIENSFACRRCVSYRDRVSIYLPVDSLRRTRHTNPVANPNIPA